jgi:hypothetical protein
MATPYMGLVKPTEGGSDGVWDTLLDALIDILDAHDHSSGNGVVLDFADISIAADKALGTYRLTGVGGVGFTNQTPGDLSDSSTYTLHLGVVGGELTWVTSGGTEVALTSGTGLNVSSAAGIDGDYTTTDASLTYSDALKAYKLLQDDSPETWAGLETGDIELFEKAAGIAYAVTLKSPGSLAASYDWVWPAALPASTSVVTVSSAGAMATTRDPSVGTLTASGAVEGSLLYHTNLRVLKLNAAAGCSYAGSSWSFTEVIPSAAGGGVGPNWHGPGSGDSVTFAIPLPYGVRLQSVGALIQDTTGSHTVSLQIGKVYYADAVATQVGTTTTSAGDGSIQTITVPSTGSLDTELLSDYFYYVTVTSDDATTTTHKVFAISVGYTNPAP